MDKFLTKPATTTSEKKTERDDDTHDSMSNYVPWVEKYRPAKIDEVSHQDETLSTLRSCLKGADLPHMLFYGPPGTGKTTTILAFCKELYGLDTWRDRVLELNASDERGINVVRQKIKDFASTAVSATKADGSPCPQFKIIILDEADSMTNAAQAALRRTMEVHSRSTRFCLICNYVSRIIDPITSRCSMFRFKSLGDEPMTKRLKMISEKESVNITDSAISALLELSEGDMRKSITFLQCVATLKAGKDVTKKDVLEISGFIDTVVVEKWLQTCLSNNFDKIQDFVNSVVAEGYAASQLLIQLHDAVLKSEQLEDVKKARILEKMSICDRRLLDGGSEYLQLLDVSCEIMKQAN